MTKIILIGAGGFVGSVLRYLASGWVHNLAGKSFFPLGTLAVNILGCFFIGLFGGWSDNRELFSPETRLFLLVGLLGGFTTYSTFGYESFALLRNGQFLPLFTNVGLHLFLGIGAVWGGYSLSRL